MVWETDADGRCTYLSRPWCEFTGQPEERGLGEGWLEVVQPEDREFVRQAFVEAARSGSPYRVEMGLRRADGDGPG